MSDQPGRDPGPPAGPPPSYQPGPSPQNYPPQGPPPGYYQQPPPGYQPGRPPGPPARPRSRWPWYLLGTVLLGLAAALLLLPDQISKASGVALPWSCQGQARDYQVALQPHLEKWEDAINIAGSTARIGLAPVVKDLQDIRRDALAVEHPDCAAKARTKLDTSMDTTIDGFLSFMSQDAEADVTDKLGEAGTLYQEFGFELGALTQGLDTAPAPVRAVTYRATGTSSSANVAYMKHAVGGPITEFVLLPWTLKRNAKPGDLLYLQVKNSGVTDTGISKDTTVTCEILVDGGVVEEVQADKTAECRYTVR